MTTLQMHRNVDIVSDAVSAYRDGHLTKDQLEAVSAKFLVPVQHTIGADRDWRVMGSLTGTLSTAAPSLTEAELEQRCQAVYLAVHDIRIGACR